MTTDTSTLPFEFSADLPDELLFAPKVSLGEEYGDMVDEGRLETEPIDPGKLPIKQMRITHKLSELQKEAAFLALAADYFELTGQDIPSGPLFRDLRIRISPDWNNLFQKIDTISDLEEGWNGYCSPAPDENAAQSAKRFLEVMKANDFAPTRIAASVVGGVGITCRSRVRKVYVEFFNNGEISALFADDKSQVMYTQRISDDLFEYDELTSQIKDYLNV